MVGCGNMSDNVSEGLRQNETAADRLEELIYHYAMEIGVPIVCGFGMLGNVLNFMVLTREKISHSLTKMEKSAHIGLIGLAVSDFMFCLMAFLFTQVPQADQYSDYNFRLFYQWISRPLITWFIITSTWLTVVMAGERYLAVCHPFKARKLISLRKTRIIILMIYVICLCLTVPLGFERYVSSEECYGATVYTLKRSPAFTSSVKQFQQLAWAILFDFIPCIALLYFNTCLVYKIHHAKKLRNAMAPAQNKEVLLTKHPRELFSYHNSNSCTGSTKHSLGNTNSLKPSHTHHKRASYTSTRSSRSSPPETLLRNNTTTPQKRQLKARRRNTDSALNSVTATLVAVVVLFLILVSPSEILKFIISKMSGGSNTPTNKIIRHITNLMQAINFSVNFILYCAVNKSFRKSLAAIFCCFCRERPHQFYMHSIEKAYCHKVDMSESES